MISKDARYEELLQINYATIETIRQAQRTRYNARQQDSAKKRTRQ